MAMEAFSNSVFELYEVAEHTAPDVFPREVARIVSKLISFDGAVFGSARACVANKAARKHSHDGQRHCDECLITDCRRVSLAVSETAAEAESRFDFLVDPVTEVFAKGLYLPLALDCKALYQGRGPEEKEALSRYPDLRKLLLYGDATVTSECARWMMLYRGTEEDFNESEASLFKAMWNHVTRTTELNLSRALDRIDPHNSRRAMALISSRGIIEAATPALTELLNAEWPAFSARSLPLPVIAALINNGIYRGRQIEISASQQFGCLACTARRIPLIDTLAPSELNVANRFAKGMTHSQIAAILHVSPHTVRNQLAQVYQKLGVHSKIELMRAMSSR